ncbi:hypothetical protein OF829_02365 [Sphingomonas sp. LB-2]|uniref:hypothetical protein n=1 Tax=Sphingomonas caeni TaxID=2984949 RepID=UPI002230FA54|nr:hypothetical protein [Sphingomonas caeni]MCW3846065.1 hypothetical protein [Sphingomonas caeni]
MGSLRQFARMIEHSCGTERSEPLVVALFGDDDAPEAIPSETGPAGAIEEITPPAS